MIALTEKGLPLDDRNDASVSTSADISEISPKSALPPTARMSEYITVMRRQITAQWQIPEGALDRPCGKENLCAVLATDAGELGTGAGYTKHVKNPWVRPRQLIDANSNDTRYGVTYSIGGNDLFDDTSEESGFKSRLSKLKSGQIVAPLGHIRDPLSGVPGRYYPLGIDCSLFVARIFGVSPIVTGEMVQDSSKPNAGDVGLPQGPSGWCPEPVRHISEIQPGDVIFREGHIVIYVGTARLGAISGGSRALRVIEATSRCGSVCESVYDPAFFDGWWIMRMNKSGPENCPDWLRLASKAELPPAEAASP